MNRELLDLATAREIIDFSGGISSLENLGNMQLEGAVALHNLIVNPEIGFGYLADEVGMGKTYIALGVVALMRYFNPTLRVLYICPSRNVQEKWDKEYLSFTKHNVKVSQFRIRTTAGKPAAPYISCKNVNEMIQMAASGYFADFFVGKDSFSISLYDDESEDKAYWNEQVAELRNMIPAHEWQGVIRHKKEVKEQYALALNYILPTFDLVIIDEAHNFKHDFESSDRNRVLSRVLGCSDENGYMPRVRNALLLSATPYDRNIEQLKNQLRLIGKSELIPETVDEDDKEEITKYVSRFMVRRLNTLKINKVAHTRNMYREEYRQGEKAEIKFDSDEQKLVTALVQKKVGEMMTSTGGSPMYQIGMMASFESYAQTVKTEAVKFDGDISERKSKDAQDRHVVDHIVDSYKESGLGLTLPHPKMDIVCKQLEEQLYAQARKQLIFVRRVNSVDEIKIKLDDHYNTWLKSYILNILASNSALKKTFKIIFNEYNKQSKYKDSDISGGEFKEGAEGSVEDNQPPKNDTIFAWFFRGEVVSEVEKILKKKSLTTPRNIRISLTAKNQNVSVLMELNWALFVCQRESENIKQLVSEFSEQILLKAKQYYVGELDKDFQDIFNACQLGFLDWYSEHKEINYLYPIIKYYKSEFSNSRSLNINKKELKKNLCIKTLFSEMHKIDIAAELFPLQNKVYDALKADTCTTELLDKLDTHELLISLCLRTGHGVIDLYLSRILLGSDNLNKQSRYSWIKKFMQLLITQSNKQEFSTYRELVDLANHLDLVIKTNIPEIFDIPREKRRTFLSHRLNPVSPVIGATGETLSSRSAQARKFRMPGYPLALISTDVFQEGEDLHTFCDSVVHYGLSGSPVGIEQKTGRVDRVNSYAQRRLLKLEEHPKSDDFIQVNFPYVAESIELLQVRQLCHNINDFIESLHEIGARPSVVQDIIESDKALADKSGIPQQIRSFLKSPYIPQVKEKFENSQKDSVISQSKDTDNIVEHVKSLVNFHCGSNVFDDEYKPAKFSGRAIRIKLDSARSSGEIILNATAIDEEYKLSQNQLLQTMTVKSWQTFHRTQAEETSYGTYRLSSNCEMLVGGEDITQADDIRFFFNRFIEKHNPKAYRIPDSDKVKQLYLQAINNPLTQNDSGLNTYNVQIERCKDMVMKFNFTNHGITRNQNVHLFEADGHCIFLSKAVPLAKLDELGKDRDRKIIEYTWVRNCNIDVVEFLLNEHGDICGRAIHPLKSLDWEEFIYCAYVLAVETDRLEYVFSQDDIY